MQYIVFLLSPRNTANRSASQWKANFTPTKHWNFRKFLKTPFSIQPALSHTVGHMHQLSTNRLIMPQLCLTTGRHHHATQHSWRFTPGKSNLHDFGETTAWSAETFMQTSVTSDIIIQNTLKVWIAAKMRTRMTFWSSFSKTPPMVKPSCSLSIQQRNMFPYCTYDKKHFES